MVNHSFYDLIFLQLFDTAAGQQTIRTVLNHANMLPVPVPIIHGAVPEHRTSAEIIQLGSRIAPKPVVCINLQTNLIVCIMPQVEFCFCKYSNGEILINHTCC